MTIVGQRTRIGTRMGEGTELHIVRDDMPSCVHHWVLSDPSEGAITGRCKRCGGERVFASHVEGNDRYDREAPEPLAPVEDSMTAWKVG